MIRTLRLFLLLIFIALPFRSALAVHCYLGATGGPVEGYTAIEPFAVPNNAKPGDKIWESNDIKIPVYCDNATSENAYSSENVYAWVNPYTSVNDTYYQLGVTYEGVDYDATQGAVNIDTHQCIDNQKLKIYTPAQIKASGWEHYLCSGNAEDTHYSRTFIARMRLYVKVISMPPHDYASSIGDYILVQFDGVGGINVSPDAANLKYHVTGLDQIRVLDCSVKFNIYPENQTIDFGTFNNMEINAKTMTKSFSIKTIKNLNADSGCTDTFKVSSSFYTTEELAEDDTSLRIGNGLQLKIRNMEDNTLSTYNAYAEYAEFDTELLTREKSYQAELSQVAGEAVQTGSFETVVLFKINYN
ncbi:type 1 fimbrial protein [Citrobacter sp. Cf108]|uniref:type 1 fimbrial protein n=1 Tax=Citrobacter sp. Cf108 TaxID=2985063 RepID=UPI002574ED51|nr:type 1 fimbrial protein [Citrobacter sp. Cf108]MDM3181214.1 type 1 fimbrial protein [Citrobacter sp. Cf108]